MEEPEVLDSNIEEQVFVRRRKLLPLWIKVFTWIFLILGAFAPISLIFGAMGLSASLSLYGLETEQPLSIIGLSLTVVFVFKWITAFGLWTEKDWAITVGQIDAIAGLVICTFMMLIYPLIDATPGFTFNFRVELLLLALFLHKLGHIKSDWMKASGVTK